MTTCVNHPGKATETACSACQRPFCEDCLVRFEKLSLCASCKAKYLQGVEERPDRVAPQRSRSHAAPRERGKRSPQVLWIGGASALVFALVFAFVVIAGLAGPFGEWRESRRYADAVDVLVSVGAALERYHADSGKFPDRLGELVPSYLPRLPDDPYGGGEPRYGVVHEKRRLWSLGPDEVDDGGEAPEDLVYYVDAPE